MKTWMVWQLLALIYPAFFYGFCSAVEFEPCFPALKNKPCNMTCRVQDFLQPIQIICNSTARGSCTLFGCDLNVIKEGDAVIYQISSLSYANDICEWSCTYGVNSSLTSAIAIYSGITHPVISGQKDADGVTLTATAHCVYPYNTSIVVQYSEQKNGQYLPLTSQERDRQWSHVPGNCTSDLEKKITATFKVPVNHEELLGKTVYFKFGFSQYDSDITVYTVDPSGPFTFGDCSQDIFLYGFLPVFLIVLIASIPINILKIDFLSKQFGEFTWKKVGITAVFCVIAIIIGVCLGLLIKGCDKKLLALGLSLFFGILLVVALIFALIYYHKKCESGSDIQDGDGGEDSCNRSSQNYTGSNTTRTATGRVGSPASTSNVELAANLNRNKTDVPKGDQSALNQKAWQSPLPLPPVASQPPTASTLNLPLSRNNQLGPIAVENEEANSSEKKKKKKKKKKKRIVDEAEDNENES